MVNVNSNAFSFRIIGAKDAFSIELPQEILPEEKTLKIKIKNNINEKFENLSLKIKSEFIKNYLEYQITSVVLSTRLKPSETLVSLTLKEKKITAHYNLISQPTISAIKKELKKKKIEFSVDKKNGHFIFEMML